MSRHTDFEDAFTHILTTQLSGVFETKISHHYNSAIKLNWEVWLVTAVNNEFRAPHYDITVNIKSGFFYRIIFNGEKYTETDSEDVRDTLFDLLENFKNG